MAVGASREETPSAFKFHTPNIIPPIPSRSIILELTRISGCEWAPIGPPAVSWGPITLRTTYMPWNLHSTSTRWHICGHGLWCELALGLSFNKIIQNWMRVGGLYPVCAIWLHHANLPTFHTILNMYYGVWVHVKETWDSNHLLLSRWTLLSDKSFLKQGRGGG